MTGCHGFCEKGPLVVIHPKKILYQKVKPENCREIFEETILKGKILEPLLYVHPAIRVRRSPMKMRSLFTRSRCGSSLGTTAASIRPPLKTISPWEDTGPCPRPCSTMKPEAIIKEVKDANLRGRGGGGFPTGVKWESCRKAHGDIKYVICNADEGDPGAYMDRSLLEGNPHSVLEGMIIGAYAIGSMRVTFMYGTNIRWRSSTSALPSSRRGRRGFLGKTSSGPDSILMSRSAGEAGPLSAENPRR